MLISEYDNYGITMNLNITKSNLQKALSAVSKAVSTKPTLEILKNISLNASKGILRVSATNLELSISTYVGVDIVEEGSTTVSAKTFSEFISLLPEGNLILRLENNELKVESEKTKSKFATIPFDEFPTLPTVNNDATLLFKIPRDIFKQALYKTTFVADRGLRQPVFSGVLFENDGKKIHMVATDSFRLSKYTIEFEEDIKQSINPIVPYISLDQILRLCDESEDDFVEAYIVSKNNQILFKTGRIEVSTSLLDGDYPNYQAIMPQKNLCTYKIKLSELVESVKLSNVFVRQEDASRIRFIKAKDASELTLYSKVSEIGEYESHVSTEIELEEDSIEIDFNPKKVLDILSRISTEYVYLDIVLHPRLENRMLIVREQENTNFLHLLTPLAGV
jgi:DNA polymerase III subunit beta